ncbi:hypothetical protein DFH06DRAFT_1392290 [Mycena polygramma]|nr:hypothetical protein DFH06DRAFT_1392290 [Mycena polygramma]
MAASETRLGALLARPGGLSIQTPSPALPRSLPMVEGSSTPYIIWYRDPSLSAPWSTDWNWWLGLRYYQETTDDGRLVIEKMLNDDFGVPGTIEPVAYSTILEEDFFFFRAAGRYYYWADGRLTVHRMQFNSPKEFLDHVRHGGPGARRMPDVVVPRRRDSVDKNDS